MEENEELEEVEPISCDFKVSSHVFYEDDIISSIICFPKLKKLVSCSNDDFIKIWKYGNVSSLQDLSVETVIEQRADEVVIFDEKKGIFLSCSENSETITSFSILSQDILAEKRVFSFDEVKSEVLHVLSMGPDIFLILTKLGFQYIGQFSTCKIIKTLDQQITFPHANTVLVRSKKFKYSFYATNGDDERSVLLMNFYRNLHYIPIDKTKSRRKNDKINEVISVLNQHDRQVITTLDVVLNSRDNEIVICGSETGTTFMYSVSHTDNHRKHRVIKMVLRTKISPSALRCSSMFSSNIFFMGDDSGTLTAIYLKDWSQSNNITYVAKCQDKDNNNPENVISSSIRQNRHPIRDIIIMPSSDAFNETRFQLITCSEDKTIKITTCSFHLPQSILTKIQAEKTNILEKIRSHVDESFRLYVKRNLPTILFQKDDDNTKQNPRYFKRNELEETRNVLLASSRTLPNQRAKFSLYESQRHFGLFERELETVMSFLDFQIGKETFLYFGVCKTSEYKKNEDNEEEEEEGNEEAKPRIIPHGYGILYRKKKTKTALMMTLRKKTSNLYHVYYIGDFEQGKLQGTGKEYDSSSHQLIFEGEYKENFREGRGREWSTNTRAGQIFTTYEGLFSRNKRHGRGESYDLKTGKVVSGFWVKGKLDPTQASFSYDCPVISYGEIEKHLKNSSIEGSGAFGIVYRMKKSLFPNIFSKKKKNEDQDLSTEYVAVKIMRVNSDLRREILFRMTKRGIGLCSSFNSKHILAVHGIIKGARQVGYLMDICHLSVDKVIEVSAQGTNMMEMKSKKRILYETAEGMRALHSKHVMHRDLKWANVMLDFDGTVKITDFDTLKEDEKKWRLQSLNAAASSRIGTPGFLAPEVFLGKRYSLSCDIYAFGLMVYAILWEMNQPFCTQYQCSCGILVENILMSNSLDYHVSTCNLRPLLVKKEIDLFPNFLIDLMILCWDADPHKRPSFLEIVKVFEGEQKWGKIYSIVILKFPKLQKKLTIRDQKMLLVEPKYLKIVNWIETKFMGSRVMCLTNTVDGSSIENDEHVLQMVKRQENPVIEVELDHIDSSVIQSLKEQAKQSRISRSISMSSSSSTSLTPNPSDGSFEGMVGLKEEIKKLNLENLELQKKHDLEIQQLTQEMEEMKDEYEQRIKRLKKVLLESRRKKNKITGQNNQ